MIEVASLEDGTRRRLLGEEQVADHRIMGSWDHGIVGSRWKVVNTQLDNLCYCLMGACIDFHTQIKRKYSTARCQVKRKVITTSLGRWLPGLLVESPSIRALAKCSGLIGTGGRLSQYKFILKKLIVS